jgi:hypothetical protein
MVKAAAEDTAEAAVEPGVFWYTRVKSLTFLTATVVYFTVTERQETAAPVPAAAMPERVPL